MNNAKRTHAQPRAYKFRILWDDMTVSEQTHTAEDSTTAWTLLHKAIDELAPSYHQITLISIN